MTRLSEAQRGPVRWYIVPDDSSSLDEGSDMARRGLAMQGVAR